MTIALFMTLVTALSLISSLLTEAIKKSFNSTKPTLVALIVSAISGWGGGAISYVFLGVPFTAINILCLFLLAPTIWLGATLGYDKVKEIIVQITGFKF